MVSTQSLDNLRSKINESLRVQRDTASIDYINAGNSLNDAVSKQNHAIFARRGCGKTLLLHKSAEKLPPEIARVYLNCEDFKRHSFPNVLIEILKSIFVEFDDHLTGWFGRKKRLKTIIKGIIAELESLKETDDNSTEDIKLKQAAAAEDEINLGAALKGTGGAINGSFKSKPSNSEELERTFKIYRDKLRRLDHWLPDLKREIREFFTLSSEKKFMFIQIDDFYHLRRADQAFVMDYIHRLCKDVPLFF